MKNITITVDDELYRYPRICAAQRDTTLTELIRSFLSNLGDAPERRARAILERLDAYTDPEITH
jgi:hypothetical protein